MKQERPELQRLVALLLASPTVRVTATPPAEAYERHVEDALTALDLVASAPPGPLVDVGSGNGVPGLVLALELPERPVVLVESVGRKAVFLAETIDALGLDHVVVRTARAEQLAAAAPDRDGFAVATSRALAPPVVSLELCLPLVRPGGLHVLYAGAVDARALERAAAALGAAVETVRPVPGTARRHVVATRKLAPTPERFPRRIGVALKRPLA